jgi:hypothetical protein
MIQPVALGCKSYICGGGLIGVYVLRNFLLKKWQFRLGGVKVRGHAGYGSWESNDSGMLLHLRCRNERRGKLR